MGGEINSGREAEARPNGIGAFSGSEIGSVPEGWEIRPVGELTTIYDGTHMTPAYVEKGVPFYSVEHLTSGNFANTKFISEEVFREECRRVRMERGDILMTRIGDIGTCKLIDWDVRASFYVSLALIKPNGSVDSSFLAQYISSASFQRELHKRTIHVAFPKKINLGEIGNCAILVPPLVEQRQIADILATWDRAIETTASLVENARTQRKSLMQYLLAGKKRLPGFSGPGALCALSDVARIETGSSNREDSLEVGEYTFFDRSTDVRRSDRYLFDGEAIIIGGEGQEFIPKYFVGKFDLHQRAYALHSFKNANGKYVYYAAYSNRHLLRRYAVGSTVPSLRMPTFKKVQIWLPSLAEQTAIAECLTAADAKVAALMHQLAALRQEKAALMQQLLTGKRRVKLDQKEAA